MKPFSLLTEKLFATLVALVRRRGCDGLRGWTWRLLLVERVLLVPTYWRMSLTSRQVAGFLEPPGSAVDRILGPLAPLLTISPTRRPRKDTVLHRGRYAGAHRDRAIAGASNGCRYSRHLRIAVDAHSSPEVAIGTPLPGSRNDCRAFTQLGVE